MADKLRLLQSMGTVGLSKPALAATTEAENENAMGSTSMEVSTDLDFDVQELAHDPVLSDGTDLDPVLAFLYFLDQTSGEHGETSTMTREIDLFMQDCGMLGPSLHPSESSPTNHNSTTNVEKIQQEPQAVIGIDSRDPERPTDTLSWIHTSSPSTSSEFLLQQQSLVGSSTTPLSQVISESEISRTCRTKLMRRIALQPKVRKVSQNPPAKYKIPRQPFQQKADRHVKESAARKSTQTVAEVGPESEQMKVVLRMIVYMQETMDSDFCDNRERQNRLNVLAQLRRIVELCLSKHLNDTCHSFRHLPGSIFERMVVIMDRDEWLRVFRQSKSFQHERLIAMGAICGEKLCLHTWLDILWDHHTTVPLDIPCSDGTNGSQSADCERLENLMKSRNAWRRATHN